LTRVEEPVKERAKERMQKKKDRKRVVEDKKTERVDAR
jgi:hypothetical protein